MFDFDFGIIGGGPAGYTLGMLLAQQGKKVVLFEKDKLGGTCLNRGCIPTKSLLHSSEVYKQALGSEEFGLKVDKTDFDFAKVAQKRDITIEKIRKGLELAVKNSGVKVVYSEAILKDKNTICAEEEVYSCSEVISAIGSKPREIKGLEFDGDFILSSDDVLKLESLPKSVLIVGSGAIGIEWTRIFSNFGVEVSLVELAEHLCPLADIEVSKRIERIFKQKKIKYYLNDKVDKIENKKVILASGETIAPDFILVATGRVPQVLEGDFAKIIGDASGEIQLAHYAISQAKALACGIEFRKDLVPSVIYGEPEIAWVGKREQDCDESCQKLLIPITAIGKSWCDDATEGFIKIIVKDKHVVGAHIISKEASALIQQIVLAMNADLSVDELKTVCVAHPTFSEGIYDLIMKF